MTSDPSQHATQINQPDPVDDRTRRRTRWLLWSIAVVLAAGVIVLLGMNIWSALFGPDAYRHKEPDEYYLYIPSTYKPGEVWPLFIGVHGADGSGLDCWKMWQPYADQEQFILLCPSLAGPGGGWFLIDGFKKMDGILPQVREAVQVEDQFFLVGFSAGAEFVQGFAFNYPERVKATVVLSAGDYLYPSTNAYGLPFSVIIGEEDNPTAIKHSETFVYMLDDTGSDVEYWVLPGVGHTVTEETKRLTIEYFRKNYGK